MGETVDGVGDRDSIEHRLHRIPYGSNYIDIIDSLAGLPVSSNYTLELIQNQGPGGNSGVRALDFEASGGSSVPEPASMGAVFLGGTALLMRRRRA